ncbi:MAG: AAA family ATPase, partial [Hyphomicrobium sp.]
SYSKGANVFTGRSMITRAIIQNYKGLRAVDIPFNPKLNILVGDNEVGKSTVLEAINLAHTGQLNRRSLSYELHPFLFHQDATAAYLAGIHTGQATPPPEIVVEIYLSDIADYADLKGTNNSRHEDCPGIKLKLALRAAKDRQVLLIEEPENHLSHTNLARLISDIEKKADGRQLVVTTHSSFVLNKLGLANTLMFTGKEVINLRDLDSSTSDYFMKLPGHDTLRMVLARRTILVEGPSDELIVQRAYKDKHGKLPLEDGVEVISVNGRAFKRFLEIAKKLNLIVAVVTDNDKDPPAVATKYADYAGDPTISIHYDTNQLLPTLEPQLLSKNNRVALNTALGRDDADDDALLKWMEDNKTECALRLFTTKAPVLIPDYIADAVG